MAGGGHLVVTYFSGVVDENDAVRLGGYPGGALGELLGVRIEEFFPLLADERVRLSRFGSGSVWSELGRATTAELLATYVDGPVAGSPAVTRRAVGEGSAWYLGTVLDPTELDVLLGDVLDAAGVHPVATGLPRGVEAVRRTSDVGSWLFVVNHTEDDVDVPVPGTDLLSGGPASRVPAGGVAVVRER